MSATKATILRRAIYLASVCLLMGLLLGLLAIFASRGQAAGAGFQLGRYSLLPGGSLAGERFSVQGVSGQPITGQSQGGQAGEGGGQFSLSGGTLPGPVVYHQYLAIIHRP